MVFEKRTSDLEIKYSFINNRSGHDLNLSFPRGWVAQTL